MTTLIETSEEYLRGAGDPTGATGNDSGRQPTSRRVLRWLAAHATLLLAGAVVVVVLLWAAIPAVFTAFDPLAVDPVSAVVVGTVLGSIIGAIAGWFGGFTDNLVGRSIDVLLSIPGFLLAITIVVLLGFGIVQAAFAVGLTLTATFARIIRSEVLKARASNFVEAATTSGATTFDILRRHVVPNSIGPTLALVTVQFGIAIIWIASLSFLGLGAQPPDPEWGQLVADGRSYIATRGWLTLWPGLTIVVVVLATNHISHHVTKGDQS